MKKYTFIAGLILFAVFLFIDTSMLAQTTGTSRSRDTRSSTAVVVAPEMELSEIMEYDYGYAFTTSSSEKNSKLSLSKHYSGQSASKTGSFIIEEGVRKIRLAIGGSVEVGQISLEIYIPGKKELKKLTIDDSADITWSQSINIGEDDTKYFGEWTYVINAKSVEGSYHMSISTY